jgi:hypothetical protein
MPEPGDQSEGSPLLARLSPVKLGMSLSLLTILYGFALGAVFGLFEDDLKDRFRETAQVTLADSGGDVEAAAKSLAGRSWTCMKRAHLHANGLGTASLAALLLLAILPVSPALKKITALLLGLGALGYSSFWMFAAFRAASMGSTDQAKESLRWLAMPTSSFCMIGMVLVIAALIRSTSDGVGTRASRSRVDRQEPASIAAPSRRRS